MSSIRGLARPLRENHREHGRASAQDQRTVARLLNQAQGINGATVKTTAAGGLVVDGGGGAGGYMRGSFGVQRSGATVKVNEGWINYHGVGSFHVAQAVLTLTGGPKAWIVVRAQWVDMGTNEILILSGAAESRPVTDNVYLVVILFEFDFNATSNSFANMVPRHGNRDIQLAIGIRA